MTLLKVAYKNIVEEEKANRGDEEFLLVCFGSRQLTDVKLAPLGVWRRPGPINMNSPSMPIVAECSHFIPSI